MFYLNARNDANSHELKVWIKWILQTDVANAFQMNKYKKSCQTIEWCPLSVQMDSL